MTPYNRLSRSNYVTLNNGSICEICSRLCIFIRHDDVYASWYCTKCRIATTIKLLKSIEDDYRDGF
jgi:hypothetical protein